MHPVFRIRRDLRGAGDLAGDAAAHETYSTVTVGSIIGVPWAPLACWFLPLWVIAVGAPVTCALLSGDFFSTAPQACLRWLRSLADAGRLAVLVGLPWSIHGDRRMWLIITDSGARMHNVLAEPPSPGTTFMWAHNPSSLEARALKAHARGGV